MSTEQTAESVVSATGNGMKSHDTYDTFLAASFGDGNLAGEREVHLAMRGNDGAFCQGWFRLGDVLAALAIPAPTP